MAGLRITLRPLPRRGGRGVGSGEEHVAFARWPANVLHFVKGGVSDAKYECGFLVSPHVSRTGNIGIEEVRAKVRALDQKFITMQSSFDAMMAKLGIMVARLSSAPSRGEILSNVDKGRSNSRKSVSSIAQSMSEEHVSKILDFGSAGGNPIILSTEIPCGSQKTSSGHEESEQV